MFATTTHIYYRLLFVITSSWFLLSCDQNPSTEDQIENTLELLNLPANEWVKYHHDSGEWWRRGHAGLAYDSTRGSLIIFGSDTHGDDWDNSIHEFSPKQRRWIHHSTDAPQDSYRSDKDGHRIAGSKQLQPWAMHSYDGVSYDPNTDSIIIIAEPQHNPIGKTVKHGNDPIWRYKLKTREWQAIPVDGKLNVNMFGSASAYDSNHNALMFCNHGLWSLSSADDTVRKVSASPKCLHSTLEYDSLNNELYLFGQYKPSNSVWKLQRDPVSDQPLKWNKLTPGGQCPPFTKTPVAFDAQAGVFVLVVNNPEKNAHTASTFAYHPNDNQFIQIADNTLPKIGMNFMIAWDHVHKVLFLVTGNWKKGITVWVMRLDLSQKA